MHPHPPSSPLASRCTRRAHWLALSAAILGVAVLAAGAVAGAEESTPAFVVIVNPRNPRKTAPREYVADAFLKRRTRWDDGETIRPVDLVASSTVRRRFSEDMLKRSVEAVRAYWQQRIFSGRGVPPPELKTDADVVEYVLKHRGGVGYVSGAAKLAEAKVLVVR